MPEKGEIVSIYWPGDTIAFKVPEGSKPGETVTIHLEDVLEAAPPLEPEVHVVTEIDPRPTLTDQHQRIQDTSLPPSYPYPNQPVRSTQPYQPTPPPGTNPPPPSKNPHGGKCKNCGAQIVWHWSNRSHQGKGGWYMCNDWDRRNFHTRQICAANQQAALLAQGTPPIP